MFLVSYSANHCQDQRQGAFPPVSFLEFYGSDVMLKSLFHFKLIFVSGVGWCPSFIFCLWLSSFLNTSYWWRYPSPIEYSWILVVYLLTLYVEVYFLVLYFVLLVYVSVFMLMLYCFNWVSLVAQMVKNPPAMQKTWVQSLSWEDPLEKGMATHFSILAWRIPKIEEPGGLQSMGLQRIRHDWVTKHAHCFKY